MILNAAPQWEHTYGRSPAVIHIYRSVVVAARKTIKMMITGIVNTDHNLLEPKN